MFDVVINEQYIDSVTAENAKYQIGFVVSVALQGLEHKYELDLDRNWIMLKNRKVCYFWNQAKFKRFLKFNKF